MAASQAPALPTRLVTPPLTVFVNDVDAARLKRKSLAQFIVNQLGHGLVGLSVKTFESRLQSLALGAFNAFGMMAAAPLPFYTLSLVI